MSSKLPPSGKAAFAIIKDIIEMGAIEIPSQFQGTGAPGDTLELLCRVERNNYDMPDLKDWEVKFHGGNALLTLFHKSPQPKAIMDKVVDRFGWTNERGQISFRHTIRGKSPRGFEIFDDQNQIVVKNINDGSVAPFWDHDTILNSIAAKMRRLILVHSKVNRVKRTVHYQSAIAYWELNLSGIIRDIQTGVICLDFDARTQQGRGSALRDHGTKFRIRVADVGTMYRYSHEII